MSSEMRKSTGSKRKTDSVADNNVSEDPRPSTPSGTSRCHVGEDSSKKRKKEGRKSKPRNYIIIDLPHDSDDDVVTVWRADSKIDCQPDYCKNNSQ